MSGRAAAVAGLTFVVLLLLSASMADVPDARSDVGTVRAFYTGNPGVIVAAQVLGLLAAAAFVVFARSVAPARAVRLTGAAVGAAAALTSVPVLVLVAVAGSASGDTTRLLVRAGDATDVLLFLAIGAFGAVAARESTDRVATWGGAVLAVLAVARAVLLAAGSALLGLVAPLAFVAYVALVSVRALLHRYPGPAPGH